MFQRFVHSEVTGSILLLICSVAALAWANSRWAETYSEIAHTQIGLSWADDSFRLSVHHWINDGLMAVFFFVVGLEIKREIVVGQLASAKRAILPVSAALGGMLVPALIYAAFNTGGAGARGWGVPMATDIAFALGILSLFGKRVPLGLKVFLAALAIADDLGAVVVIAIFYTTTINVTAIVIAAVFLGLIVVASQLRIRRAGVYLLLAIGVWIAVLASGLHTTIAGTLIAMLVPVRAVIEPAEFLALARRRLDELEATEFTRDSMLSNRAQLEAIDDIYLAAEDMAPAGIVLERQLHPLVTFIVLPLFALFNAGVKINTETLTSPPSPVMIGIVLGLVFGKQIGVCALSWLAVRSGRADLPEGVTWAQIWGVSALAGVGFTMSLFVGELAFTDPGVIAEAKLGILAASMIAGILGILVLRKAL
jgi:NhaA family Na+:H+ antiporter